MELVREYQRAASLEEADRLGGELIGRVMPVMRGIIAHKCPSRVVDDVSQTVCVTIINGLHKCRRQTEAGFWAWCVSITRHKCADSYRKEQRTIPMDPEDVTRLLDEALQVLPVTESEKARMRNLITALTGGGPCDQLLFWQFVQDWSPEEIGRELDISPAAARMRVRRCVDAVRARAAAVR